MKVKYLDARKRLIFEIEETRDNVRLPRIGESVVGFENSYKVQDIIYFYTPTSGTSVDHINVVLMADEDVIRERMEQYKKMTKKSE